jgi:hypothetical protein
VTRGTAGGQRASTGDASASSLAPRLPDPRAACVAEYAQEAGRDEEECGWLRHDAWISANEHGSAVRQTGPKNQLSGVIESLASAKVKGSYLRTKEKISRDNDSI